MNSTQVSQATTENKEEMQKKLSKVKATKKENKIIGPPWLTRFEKARILGARATQLAMGAPPLIEVPPNVKDPLEIAKLELEKGVLPLVIKRKLPNGETMYIRAIELLKIREAWKPFVYKIIESETSKE
jgi:DNA-directed RNA polymerase subunit K/omega